MTYEHVVGQRRIKLVPDRSVVAFEAGSTATATLKRELQDHVARSLRLPTEGLTLLELHEPASKEMVQESVARHRTARENKAVFRVRGHYLVTGREVLVGFRRGARRSRILSRVGVSTLDRLDDIHVVEHPEGRPFEIAEDLRAHPDVAWAEPHFSSVHHRPHLSSAGTSAASGNKRPEKGYELRLTDTWNAWAVQSGHPTIRIAVIDEGVQTSHPSLRPIVADTYDATKNRARQSPHPWEYHGTACAGLAAAAPGSGPVRGFGGGCGLMCVRMGYTSDPESQALITRTFWMARALKWSWKNGAGVLSCSWSAGEHSNAIIQVIGEARKKGRRGKGCVVVFAAGNEGDDVNFPASVRGVLTVAACNQYDEPKTGTSADGERFWASNFGPQVDLAAPAIGIVTLDNRGTSGHGTGDFIDDFNGTSSATPMVAGIAGLILSANPSLTESEVRSILRRSAAKVGSVPYVRRRNDMMGWGRLDGLKAVELAAR